VATQFLEDKAGQSLACFFDVRPGCVKEATVFAALDRRESPAERWDRASNLA